MRSQLAGGVLAGVVALVASPGAALPQTQAYTNGPVYLYAGPGGDYPVVSQLPSGLPVTVMGCVSDYTWCDVALPELRGWAYGGSLNYPYQGAAVPLMSYGTMIGIPIVGFTVGSYWSSYYRDRPWYRDRDRWDQRRPPPGPPGGRGYRPGGPEFDHRDGRPGPDYGRGEYRAGPQPSQGGRPPGAQTGRGDGPGPQFSRGEGPGPQVSPDARHGGPQPGREGERGPGAQGAPAGGRARPPGALQGRPEGGGGHGGGDRGGQPPHS
jgi:uncharacterized protein YraI